METTEVCEIDVATRRIVGGSDSPPDLDSPGQVNTINMVFFVCVVLWMFSAVLPFFIT